MTAPATGLAVSLPRAGALTDALVAEVGDGPDPEALGRLRHELARDLAALVAELPPGERLRLDGYRFGVARENPERLGSDDDDDFVASPVRCRRAVGLAAVTHCVRGRAAAPAAAVAAVLRHGVEDVAEGGDPGGRPPWWAAWYGGLGPGGRAVVEAEAVTWATQLWTALDWGRLGRAEVGGRDDWWDCPGTRALTVRGRSDVRCRVGGRPVLLVVGSGVPGAGWHETLGFPALVAALAGGDRAVPGRVVGLWPASGQVRILPVDGAVLAESATAVVGATATWVDARLERHGRG